MGGKQSKLKKELAALQAEVAASTAKHAQDVETLRNEKRMLEFKLHALQEMTAKAQLEAEAATHLAVEHEQRAKALKWELVRRVSAPVLAGGVSPATTLTASTSSSIASLASGDSAIPRVPVSWKLKEGATLRRSNTSISAKRSMPPQRESSELLKKTAPSSVVEMKDQPVALAKLQPQTLKPHDSSTARPAPATKPAPSNQDDAVTPTPQKAEASAPAYTPPPVASAAAANLDIFAPVKRRSSTRDSIVSVASSITAAEAKSEVSGRVDSFQQSPSAKDSGSDSDRESSRKSESSSRDDEQREATRRDNTKGARGVFAATKGRGPSESKADDVLALSDDEDD